MSSSHPASSLYKPTEEEEAYGFYVFDKLFGTFPVGGSIRLEAKPTLVILEKSDVDAIILRTIWSVADPENKKYLTDIAQFHVILRLITLAQDGLLERELNKAFNNQRNKTTPVAVFQKTLWFSQDDKDYPLPTFQGVSKPSRHFLNGLISRIKLIQSTSSPAPAPAPSPVPRPVSNRNKTPAPAPAPKLPPPPKLKHPPKEDDSANASPIPAVINLKKKHSQTPTQLEAAIQQIETLGVDSPNPLTKNLKELDPDNFELLQEQAALQNAIMESNSAHHAKTSKAKPEAKRASSFSKEALSEEAALQKAIYESTYAASPPRPTKTVATIPVPKNAAHENWLRMSAMQDSLSEYDNKGNDSDDEYKKKKTKKGDAAYAEYVASQDPPNIPQHPPPGNRSDAETEPSDSSEDFDKKPAAKPVPKKKHDNKSKSPGATNKKGSLNSKADDRIDEYPQAVQELVMNGFELQKAIQGYKMLGDNFDDIVLFLTSNMTVKELVINGFNIHKVVQAYDLIGDNMDDLLAYLMANAT